MRAGNIDGALSAQPCDVLELWAWWHASQRLNDELFSALQKVTRERDEARCRLRELHEEHEAEHDKLERLEREAARLRVFLLAQDGVYP